MTMKATVIAEKPGKYSWNDGGVVYSKSFDSYRDASDHLGNIMTVGTTPNGYSTYNVRRDDGSGVVVDPGVHLDIIVDTSDEG